MYVWDVDPNHGKEIREERWQRLKEEKTMTFESEHKTRDGEVYPVEITNHYIEFGGVEYEFAFVKDISERKEREKELEELSERYNSLYEGSQDAVYVHDFEGNFIDADPTALDMFGYSEEEIQSLSFEDLLTEDQLPKAEKVLEQILETGVQEETSEFKIKRKMEIS